MDERVWEGGYKGEICKKCWALFLRVGLSICMWEYVRCIIVVCVNAWHDWEQYKQFGPDIISKLLVRIIEMLSDAKAMCQQTDTHCERNTNANIIDHSQRERNQRHKHTWLFISFNSGWWLNNYSSVRHQMLTCFRLLLLFIQDRSSRLSYWPSEMTRWNCRGAVFLK